MKPLALLVLVVALSAPAAAEEEFGSFGALKKDLKGFKTGGAPDQPRPIPTDLQRPEPPARAVIGRPGMLIRHVQDRLRPSLRNLSVDLQNTAKNISALVRFIHRLGDEPPLPKDDEAWARKTLAFESAVAAELAADGEAALAKGVVREKSRRQSLDEFEPVMPIEAPRESPLDLVYPYPDPTPEQKAEGLAILRGNHAHALGFVIELKLGEHTHPGDEANAERTLALTRKQLAEAAAARKP